MTTNIRNATDLWIEAGQASGGTHHHIELPNDLAEYFDTASRDAEVIRVRLPDGTVLPRPLVRCGAGSGQRPDIWHLALPTNRLGGPLYAGRVIRLTREQEGPNAIYALDVADAGSNATVEWDVNARSSGNIGTMTGPHGTRFGYW